MARPIEIVKRSEVLRFRTTPLEKKIIELTAKESGLNISDFIRKCVMNKKVRIRFSGEELEAYTMLQKYHDNFRRISNLIKNSREVSPELKTQIKEVQAAIYGHLQKFNE